LQNRIRSFQRYWRVNTHTWWSLFGSLWL